MIGVRSLLNGLTFGPFKSTPSPSPTIVNVKQKEPKLQAHAMNSADPGVTAVEAFDENRDDDDNEYQPGDQQLFSKTAKVEEDKPGRGDSSAG